MIDPFLVIVIFAVIAVGVITAWSCYAPDRAVARAHRRNEAERRRVERLTQESSAMGSSPRGTAFPVDRFSLTNGMEVVAAFSIVLAISASIDPEFALFVFFFAVFYAFKNLLGRIGPRHKALSVIAYSVLCAPLYVILVLQDREGGTTWFGHYVLTPWILLAVPTASFLFDVLRQTPTKIRILVWRSLFEVLIVIPGWMVFWFLVGLVLGAYELRLG